MDSKLESKKVTICDIINKKNKEKIVMLTAYDALFGKIFDELVDILLIGDSLNMSFNGEEDTLNLTLEHMIYHTKAVKRVNKHALIVADLPFGYMNSKKDALKACVKIFKKSGADAIKIEGGKEIAPIIKELCNNGIAVMGHIGLKPQSVRKDGGYKVARDLNSVLEDAKALCDAGVFSIVIEGTVSSIAKKITDEINVPTIGIGSGMDVDGQVLVWSDMLGFFNKFKPKFVKKYLDGASIVKNAVMQYADDVKNQRFPTEEYQYTK